MRILGIRKGEITGKLISRLEGVGSRSEGPIYFIIPSEGYPEWNEIPVRKRVMPWMKDLVLHDLIGEIITIKGEITETKDTISIDYEEVIHNGEVLRPKNWKKVLNPKDVDKMLKL